MLFELNSSDAELKNMAYDYLNIPMKYNIDKDEDINDPKMGLSLGNMYKDEYKPYKNMTPKKLMATNEQEKMLLKIQELDFAINDLSLKLDVEPNNYELYELFKNYALELKKLCEEYAKHYQPLELIKDTNGGYSWYKNPWPWDGGKKYV